MTRDFAMSESEAVGIATRHVDELGIAHGAVRSATYIGPDDPLHLPWENAIWSIRVHARGKRPPFEEDFGGLNVIVDCKTRQAEIFHPL